MPRAYLVAECSKKSGDPIKEGQPTTLLIEPVDWTHEFESWFVEENYAIIDDEGNRYILRWDSSTGMSADTANRSSEFKAVFYKWMEMWIDSLPPRIKIDLGIRSAGHDEAYMNSLLANAEALRRLAKRK